MRVLIMFDLPTYTAEDRRRYQLFHKALINEGFLMIQESVYARIAINRESAEFLEERVREFAPRVGLVQSLIVTEKQYASIKFLSGKPIIDPRNSTEGTVVI